MPSNESSAAQGRCLCAERDLLGDHEEPCAGFGTRSDELCEQAEREAVAAGEWPPESPAASTLRELAEQARDDQPTWWLWDEPLIGGGKMLAFASAATPEAVLALLDEVAELKKRLGYPEFAR